MKIAVTPRSFPETGTPALQWLLAKGYDVEINTTGKVLDENGMAHFCNGAEGLIVGIDPVTATVMDANPQLKVISKYGAGLDNIDLKAASDRDIQVMNAGSANALSVAELAVGLFFSLARGIQFAVASTKAGGWARKRGVELFGKTAGIVGLGNIGREVARIALGIGMNAVAYDPYVRQDSPAVAALGIGMKPLDEVLSAADFVTLHLPSTEETRHMVNRDTLRLMKHSACLVNTSRGELVDEEALYEALTQGVIAGAASDVFSKEPPDGHPLLALNNFILTPHIGAYTGEANRRMAETAVENLLNMLQEKNINK
jgi:D-3-phosphoglycerate dehydrogenase